MKIKGSTVVLAGLGLNLALGVLYAWSVFGKQFTEPLEKGGFGWTKTQSTYPYTLAIAVFALMMIPAGRLQDKLGPRLVATAGAVLTGLGLIVAGFSGPSNIYPALIGFGLMAGAGIGLGYASATPAAVKWFPPAKKGLITGLVVSGFGLAPVYIAPLSKYLLAHYGLGPSFQILGAAFAVTSVVMAQMIRNPAAAPKAAPLPGKAPAAGDGTWRDMLKNPIFYFLYFEYACAATAGLMIIGHLAKIVAVQSGNALTIGFMFVAVLALFNAGGRIVAGILSDHLGRENTLGLVCLAQSVVMVSFSDFSSATAFTIGSAVVGFNYGACLALFPATTADYWGTKNLGHNYGIVFTAWGVGGVFGPILAGRISDATGSYGMAFKFSAALLILAVALVITQGGLMEMERKSREKRETAR